MVSPTRRVCTGLAAAVSLGATLVRGAPPAGNGAAAPPSKQADAPKVSARLLAERPALVPGKTANLGLLFTMQPEWHIYANALNDAGSPPVVEWTLPPGFKVLPTRWPAPVRLRLPGDMLDHVYQNEVLLIVPVSVPADAKPGTTAKLSAELSVMVCKNVCLVESHPVSIELPIQAQDIAQVVPDSKFLATQRRLPVPVKLGPGSDGEKAGILSSWSGTTLKFQVKDAKALTFYPLADSAPPVNTLADGTAAGDALAIRFEPGEPGKPAKSAPVHGVLEIKRSDAKTPETGVEFYEVSLPRPVGH
jgi:DsbC/DsbD-like thiol-disulfide interchange protein